MPPPTGLKNEGESACAAASQNDSESPQHERPVHLALDVGSTTLKVVVLEREIESGGAGELKILHESYQRHKFDVHGTIEAAFESVKPILQDRMITATITGSAGMQIADVMDLPHVQEVVACGTAITELISSDLATAVDVAVELGGEDSKIIYFVDGAVREARMNSTCAAGTGSFLDQMAALLGTDTLGLNALAANASDTRHPIASRCGVFAKSDIQPLLAEGVAKEDIAASIIQSVVTQTVAGLACGRPIKPSKPGRRVAFLGGPLHFLDTLRETFADTLDLSEDECVSPPYAHQMVCRGAALQGFAQVPMPFAFLEKRFHRLKIVKENFNKSSMGGEKSESDEAVSAMTSTTTAERLDSLFSSEEDYQTFKERHAKAKVQRMEGNGNGEGNGDSPLFLGIDSGSTTIKTVLIDSNAKLVASTYDTHKGDTLSGAISAILSLHASTDEAVDMSRVKHVYVTGYGENLLKTALRCDGGIVETIAHLTAARHFKPETDFVLDIGGQDMKAMRVDENGVISEVHVNEACSSGCGTFLFTLAESLGLSVSEFADRGKFASAPLDLGTRCTVFMGSRIKQAQKDGATVEDISSGLAVSVVKNALFKVMRMRTADDAGKHIVVQGGTFLNDCVLRAVELILERDVVRPDISGHMGAFGAALIAREAWKEVTESEDEGESEGKSKSAFLSKQELEDLEWTTDSKMCGKCSNNCQLIVNEFSSGDTAVLGNRCDRGAGAIERKNANIPDLWSWTREITFKKYTPLSKSKAKMAIGVPRVLQMYDDYPFWYTLLTELGFRVVLSKESTDAMFNLGMSTIPDEGVCTPARLVHGHIESLKKSGVRVIFYPGVQINREEPTESDHHFNCSLMSAYPDVIQRNVPTAEQEAEEGDDEEEDEDKVKILTPQLPMNQSTKFPLQLFKCLKEIVFEDGTSVTLEEIERATVNAYAALDKHRQRIRDKGEEVLEYMKEHNVPAVILSGRPYHMDPLLSSAIPHMLTAAGYAVLTNESVCHRGLDHPVAHLGLNVFTYDGRAIAAAQFAATRSDIGMIQLISFGCSISPNTDDEVKNISRLSNFAYCCIKIDQNTSVGAVRVRVRSLLAATEERIGKSKAKSESERKDVTCPNTNEATQDSGVDWVGAMKLNDLIRKCPKAPHKLAIFPFSESHMKLWITAFNSVGFHAVVPDATSKQIHEAGMKYCNPDLCYGVTLTAGRFIHGFTSGQLDPDHTSVLWMHTAGVCTAVSMAHAIRASLRAAGYPQVEVHCVDFSGGADPGVALLQNFRINMSMSMSDVLEKCLLRCRPYESVPGSTNALFERLMEEMVPYIDHGSIFKFKSKIKYIVNEFEKLPLTTEERYKPKVGWVGLMARHCPEMWDWIIGYVEQEQGCEVIMGDMGDFGLAPAVNNQINYKIGYDPNKGKYAGTFVHKFFINVFREPALEVLRKSRRFYNWLSIDELYKLTDGYFTPGSVPSGESWLPLAQALHMKMNLGVNNIVFNVPFACLPSHVSNKAMFRRLRQLHPSVNIVCLEYDSTTSTLNQFNRVKLMLECMEERTQKLKSQTNGHERIITCTLEDMEDMGASSSALSQSHCTACNVSSVCTVKNPKKEDEDEDESERLGASGVGVGIDFESSGGGESKSKLPFMRKVNRLVC